MFLFLPMGVEGVTVRRIPWVSILIAALTALVFLASWPPPDDRPSMEELTRVLEYWQQRPYLELPADFRSRFVRPDSKVAAELDERHQRALASAPEEATVLEEQARLEAMAAPLLLAGTHSLLYRLAMVPKRGVLQWQMVTNIFIHFGWMHLLGNLLFFYIAGLILEDLWGRPLFAGFYVAGGVIATLSQWALDPHSQIQVGGASGAIAACMGAFALRLAATKIRIGYLFFIGVRFFRGTFLMPAWIAGGVWVALEIKDLVLGGATANGTAVMAHVGGFGFGMAVAYAIKVTRLEERVLAPAVEAEHVAYQQDPRIGEAEQALAAGDLATARRLALEAQTAQPEGHEPLLVLAKADLQEGNPAAARPRVELLFQRLARLNQPSAVWSAVEELGNLLQVELLSPAVAFKIAAQIEGGPDGVRGLSERFYARAGEAGGTLGAKALLKAAEVRMDDFQSADVALEYLQRAQATPALGAELQQRVEAAIERARTDPRLTQRSGSRTSREVVELPAQVEAEPEPLPPPSPEDLLPKIVECRLGGMDSGGLTLEVPGQAPRRVTFGELLAVSVAAAGMPPVAGVTPKPVLFTDFVLSWGDERGGARVLRVPSTGLGLGRLYPAMPASEAYGELLKTVLEHSGASALPPSDQLRKGQYPRFASVSALNAELYGAA